MNKNIVHRQFNMFGVNVGITSFNKSTHVIKKLIDKKTASYVCIINVHVLVTAARGYRFRQILNTADWSFPDGVPLVWYAKHFLSLKEVERVAGPSLMNKCFEELPNAKHFFLGATDYTLKKLVAIAKKNNPNINICGYVSPPFRQLRVSEQREIVTCINKISPDIIWVALGAPKQETWMWRMQSEIKRGVMIGVGAAFDYYAGNIKRPPVWIRRSGLEWLCRLYQDPVRLSKRYCITNSLFIFLIIKEIFLSRHSHKKRRLIS